MPRKRKGAESAVTVQNGQAVQVQNGLADLCRTDGPGIGGGINPGNPYGGSNPWAPQISQVNTLERNLRYYLVSNFRQLLSEAYVEIGLIQAICDIPVDDGLRGGVELKSQQLDEEQIAELTLSLDRDDDLTTVGQAAKWNRLFGGAGIIILTDQDPEEPFEIESVGPDDQLEFRAVDMWELFWDKQNTEGYDPTIQSENFSHYSYYGEKIHKSRVMRLKGITAPSFVRPRLRGWGFSVVEILVRSINQYLKATDLGFEVLDEFKIDVYKIKNLTNSLMSPIGTSKVRERMAIANWLKNYQNAIVMDSEDDFDHKQLSFSGLAETMAGIRQQVASDMRMPMLKLFGTPAQGLNASDEESLEVYNSMVESQVRNKLKYDILRICEIKCQKLFGFVPDDLSLAFKPLRILKATDEETVKTQKFQRLIQAKAAGELTTEEFRDACNKGGLMDVMLDTSDAALDDVADEAAEAAAEQMGDTEDGGNDGADRLDSEKPKANKEPKKKLKNDKWEESEHPRDDDGQFTVHHSSHEKFASKDIKPSEGGYFGAGFYVHKDKEATRQYGDNTHTYKLSKKPVFDLSGDKLKPEALKVFKEMGLDVEKITTPSQFIKPVQKAIMEIRKAFPGEETVGTGAMEKLRSFLKEKGFIGIQFSHNDTDENMVIFDKKDLQPGGAEKEKKKNAPLLFAFKPYTRVERAKRTLNSGAFDKASYEADGGDGWIDPRRSEFFTDPIGVDTALWARAKEASRKAFGVVKWQFVVWWYKKQGGHFT